MDANEPITITVTVLCSVGLIFNIFEVFHYWFQSQLKSRVTALVSLLAYIITAAYKVLLYVWQKSVIWFAFATSVDYIVVAIALLLCYRKYNGAHLRFSWACGLALLKKSYHFILPSMMVAIYGYADKFMLKHMVSDAESAIIPWRQVSAGCGPLFYPPLLIRHILLSWKHTNQTASNT